MRMLPFLFRMVVVLSACLGPARADSTGTMPETPVARAMAQGYWGATTDPVSGRVERGPLFRMRVVEALREEEGGAVSALEGFDAAAWRGEPARRARFEALREAVATLLARQGFAFAELELDARPDGAGAPHVDVTVRVRRGSAFVLGNPMPGGTRTRPDVVRRLALWDEGEPFDPSRIRQGIARLRRTGYFEDAAWEGTWRDPARNVLYPALRLPDARASTVGGILGYDTEADGGARLAGFVDVRLLNLRGTARDLEFSYDGRTGNEREARLAYVEPWIWTLPVGARWEGSFLQQDTVFQEWEQDLAVFRDLDMRSRVEATIGTQANRDLVAGRGTRAFRSGVGLAYDSRDRAFLPRNGTRSNIRLTGIRRDLDAPPGGSDSSYFLAQATGALERWEPLGGRFGLRLGVRGAVNFPFDRLNRGELHDLGGARSLRGYREREFQTNAFGVADAEVQYRFGGRGQAFAFASPGLVNRPVGHLDPVNVLGYGAGLEMVQGDWSVALTYALNPGRSFGNGYLHAFVENRF